jgi:hypothetical protein
MGYLDSSGDPSVEKADLTLLILPQWPMVYRSMAIGTESHGVAGGSSALILYLKLLILLYFLIYSSATPCYPPRPWLAYARGYANLIDETLP